MTFRMPVSRVAGFAAAAVFGLSLGGPAAALDQAVPLGQFSPNWMVELCETDKNGDIRPDSEIKECCDNNTAKCGAACDDYPSEERSACYDRCGDASRLCYKRAGEKEPGVGPVRPLFPGLRRMFRQQQPNVVAPTQ